MLPPRRRTRALQRRLLDWYADTGRDLPWRRPTDPYGVLVSELMLQQTQAARVESAWPAFLERFPTVAALAAAPTADVVEAWKGLGYNRRAVNLQRAARVITERYGGQVPADVEALESLPGVGPYTARAVATFAFDAPAAPVDTNVARVLARAVTGSPLDRRGLQELADALVDDPGGPAQDHPAAWSHALMDLGARCCTARAPRCEACPVDSYCAWRRHGDAGTDPAAPRARPGPQERFEGSDRYHRGRLVDALRQRRLCEADLPVAASLEDDEPRLERVVAGLVRDGLAEWCDGLLGLPGRGV